MAADHQAEVAGRSVGSDTCRELLQRVLASRHFEKSARMREFLTYVCERAITDGQSREIHEQEIGCAVFGRAPSYDTGQDNIVRVNASQVRRKLELYFAAEGALEPVIFEIPPGKYVPLFRERPHAQAPHPIEAEPAKPLEVPLSRFRRAPARPIWLLAGLSPLLLIVCIGLLISLREQNSQTLPDFQRNATLNALWSQLLDNDTQTDIVVADSSLGLVQDLTNRTIPLAEYLHPDLWRHSPGLEAQAAASLASGRHYTSVADVGLTRRIVALAGHAQNKIAAYSARDLGIRQMKSDHLLLFGSKQVNPWIELVENRMNFRFGHDPVLRQSYFINMAPLPGEAASYRNSPQVSYCEIAFLPNLTRTGNILVISGTEMEGTDAGGEFLTDARAISGLVRVVPIGKDGRFPYFEVLLKASKMGGSSPAFEIVCHRLPRL